MKFKDREGYLAKTNVENAKIADENFTKVFHRMVKLTRNK